MILKKLKSIFQMKCPHCTEGDFYDGKFFKANVKERCEVCNRSYSKEPGFYQGSYYVSYGLGVGSFVAMWIATTVIMGKDANVLHQLGIIIGGMIIMMPFLYPLSKIIWANLFISFKGKKESNGN